MRKLLLVLLALGLTACPGIRPSFTISLSPDNLTVPQGQSGTTQLTITPQNGFTETVSLSLLKSDGSPAPSGITLSPTSVNVSGGSPVNQPLTISVDSSVQAGTYSLKVRASSGSITREASLSLTVSSTSTSGPYTLSGTVVSEGAGGPVVGSTVRLYLGTTQVATATTDAQGRFSFANLPEGTFRLEAQKPGMAGSSVEGIQVPKVSQITLIQKPAFDGSLSTTPPTLLITQDGSAPLAGQTFTDAIPLRVQVDASSDHVKPMRLILVALGRTPGSLMETPTSSGLVFFETEDTGNQVLLGSAVAGLGDADGEEVYLEVVAYDFNNNRSHYLIPLTFVNTSSSRGNSVGAPQEVTATAITLGQALGLYSVKAPLKLKVPLGRGLFGELSLDPQAVPEGSNLFVEVRWCYTDTSAPPFAFDIERSTDGQNWTRVGTVGGDAISFCPSDPFGGPFYFLDASADLTPGQTYLYRVVARGANQAASAPSSTTPLPPFFAPLLSPPDEATGVSKTPGFTIGHPQLGIGADGAAYTLVLWDTLTGEGPAWVTLLRFPLLVEFGTGDQGNGIPPGEALVYGVDPFSGLVVYTDTAGLRDPSKPNRVPVDVVQGTVTMPYNFDGFAALPELQALRTYAWELPVSFAYKYEGNRIGAYSIQTLPGLQPGTQVFEFTTGE